MIKYSMKKIANNLRLLRNNTGKSQLEIAMEIDISQRTYQRLESNELKDIKLSHIVKIINYYNITFEELLK